MRHCVFYRLDLEPGLTAPAVDLQALPVPLRDDPALVVVNSQLHFAITVQFLEVIFDRLRKSIPKHVVQANDYTDRGKLLYYISDILLLRRLNREQEGDEDGRAALHEAENEVDVALRLVLRRLLLLLDEGHLLQSAFELLVQLDLE